MNTPEILEHSDRVHAHPPLLSAGLEEIAAPAAVAAAQRARKKQELRTRIAHQLCGSCKTCVAVRQGKIGIGFSIMNSATCETFTSEGLDGRGAA